ncbi:hypothetical protein BDL97_03G132000 [Sphagnum fallax]|nr:hypothetical protein BDL97_03G132000 [Sphagnum fallax]
MWSRVFLLLWVVGYGVLVWCQLSTAAAQASSNNVSSTLFPPMGNSLQSTVKTSNAMHTYVCDNDESWILVRAAGELLDFDTEQVVGDYTPDFSSGYPVINFTLLNSAADAAESGSLTSSVSVSPIVTVMSNGTTESLSQATSHQNLGAASMVSYVVLLNPQGGQAPAASLCTDEFGTLQSISVKVPFSAVFEIYTQNVVPPPVPGSLNVPNARLIEGFFAQGSMSYQYNGSMWLEQILQHAFTM